VIEPTVLHLRLVFPKDFRGRKTAGHAAQAFVTFPGEEERPLPGVVSTEPVYSVESVVKVTLTLVATTEVVYE
jgi:hypothetical protein